MVGRGRGPRRRGGGIAFNSCLFAHFFGSGQELQMKLQPGTPVETNDVHALSISFSSGEFLRVLREQKPRELENKKRRNITVDSRGDVWIFRQHTAFLHHPLNSKGHGRIFQEYCTVRVQWCVPCPSSLVVTRSARAENSNSSPLARASRAAPPVLHNDKKRRRCSRNHFSIVDPTLARTASSLRKEDVT